MTKLSIPLLLPFWAVASFALSTSTTTTRTSAPQQKEHDYDAPGLSIGGADMAAYANGHVAQTQEYEPMLLPNVQLPRDFPTGTYFKNGPGAYQSDDGVPYLHPFDCNGKILAVTLDADKQQAVYRYKHVQTPKYIADQTTGTMSERGFFGTRRRGGWLGNVFQGMDPKNPANTGVIMTDNQQHLYALWEAGRPFAMDPHTLETRGEDFCGFLTEEMSFSAHPSYDPRQQTFTNFCVSRPQPGKETSTVTFQEVNANSFQVCNQGLTLELPGIITTHDMILSENYIVFNWNEAKVNGVNALKALMGLVPPFALVDPVPLDMARFLLIPRALLSTGETIEDVFADERIRIVDAPYHVAVHFTNAYETTNSDNSNKLVFEATCLVGKDHSYGVEDMVKTGKPLWEAFDWDGTQPQQLEQFEIDLDTGTLVRMETIGTESIEFTTVPRELYTQQHNFVFSVGMHKPRFADNEAQALSPYGSIRKINVNTKEQEVFSFAPYEFVHDGDVVAKVGAKAEDAVYFVSVVTNGRDLTSDLVIFDGEDIGAGPVVRLRLPEVLPNNGLHGQFYKGPNRFSFD